jgi:hypothetical protein
VRSHNDAVGELLQSAGRVAEECFGERHEIALLDTLSDALHRYETDRASPAPAAQPVFDKALDFASVLLRVQVG